MVEPANPKPTGTKAGDETLKQKEYGVDVDTYDRHIVPAETAARKEREGSEYKHPVEDKPEVGEDSIKTTEGYTVDKEGLANNYAIEPEMYVNEPGDLADREAGLKQERAEELDEINNSKEGQLSMNQDSRGKGQGNV